MMQPLITRNDIAAYRQMSKTGNDDKLNEIILDAQLLDLQPLIGEGLYNKLLESLQDLEDLWNGGMYEFNGISYSNYGLKMVLVYFAYARYMMFSSITDTPFSIVEKLNPESRPAETTTKKTIYTLNRDVAFKIWDSVKNYLIRTKQQDYISCANTSAAGLRFTKIG
ncbi:DUF6712 family protein [Flavobacterium rhizosphaerae]|uniref:Uncharacterized protein n=1 Tax=Flavobacterium rhizosphaerae TaxID=3163298 RepID=A0ABW8YZ29_9FLAO